MPPLYSFPKRVALGDQRTSVQQSQADKGGLDSAEGGAYGVVGIELGLCHIARNQSGKNKAQRQYEYSRDTMA